MPSRELRCRPTRPFAALPIIVGKRVYEFSTSGIIVMVGVTRLLTLAIAAALCATAAAQPHIDAALVRDTVEAVGAVIAREYFAADVGERVQNALRQRHAAGRYDRETTPDALATALTRDLLELTSDKHLAVMVSVQSAQAQRPTASPRPRCSRPCGFAPVEILPGNIGYVNVTFFFRPEEARESLAEAMHMVRDAAALIFDMRRNGGGSPGTVALLASYLFVGTDIPLFEIVDRSGDIARYSTEAVTLPDRNGTRPVYVLTSARTFSAGEGLPFLLQELERAIVIGETTAGAANAGARYRINDHFEAQVSNSTVRTVKTGRNWEGRGVTPDIAVASEDALRVAVDRARR